MWYDQGAVRDIPGGKPGIFAGEKLAEGQDFCWSGIFGHEASICHLAEKLGFLFGPHLSSWGKFCRMMVLCVAMTVMMR